MKTIIPLIVFCGFAYQTSAQVSFTLSFSPGVGPQPRFVTTADVNADGKMDLVTCNGGNNTFSVLTNGGTGGFTLSSSPAVGNDVNTVLAADVNGDGNLDLITASYTGGLLTVLTNDGRGGFVLSSSPGVGTDPISFAAADVNGDGKVDLISANSGGNTGNTLTVLTNNGSGGFASAGTCAVGINPWQIIGADVNGDGNLDLITANNGDNTLSVLTNNGSGGFVTAGTYAVGNNPRSVAAADVNGDGRVDLICANMSDNTISVLTNNGSGRFVAASTYPVGNTPVFVIAADVNGDGKVDLVSANYGDSTLSMLTNDGSGGFVTAGTNAVGSNPRAVVASDVNGDGKVDLVSANYGANTISVLTNGTPFPPPSLPIITTQPIGRTNLVGTTATFSVGATVLVGQQLFSYQWRLAGTNLPAATNNPLVLTNLTLSQAGNYDVVITNYAGSVTSSPANLDVRFILVKVNGQPAAGTMSALVSAIVTIFSGYPNGFTFYTLDGSIPTFNSTFYSGPITLSNSAVVQVMSLSSDFTQSAYSSPINVQIAGPLNVSTPGGGSLTVNGLPTSPASNYLTGAAVTLAATASNGWTFMGWQGGASGTNNPLSLIMSQTNNIQAIFGTVVATNSSGGGSVVLSQPNPVPYGTILTASAEANSGSYFLVWGGAASGTNAPTKVAVTNASPNISALFTTLPGGKYSLSVVVVGNGSVTNSLQRNYYNPGDSVTLKAITNAGTYFLGWTQDAMGTNNPLTVLMTTNKIVQANFGVLPIVSISPLKLTVLAGSNAVLTASASGPPLLTYQWQNNQGAIASATNAIYTIFNAQPTNAGNYWVMVSNSFGSVTSAVSTVIVIGVPTITNQPPPLTTVISGHSASFVVAASGWPALAYQWQFNGANLIGANNTTLALQNVFPADAGIYTVAITNVYGSVTSNPAMLTVLPLNITSPARLANGQFQFTFDTADGVQYAVEYSTNLMDWHPLMTIGGNGAPLTLTDPNTTGSLQRFYRIVQSSP